MEFAMLQKRNLVGILMVLCTVALSACAPVPKEGPVADVEKARKRVYAVFKNTLGRDLSMAPMQLKMKDLGINTLRDPTSKDKLQKALKAEFGIDFPDPLFKPDDTVYAFVEYVADKCYGLEKEKDEFIQPSPYAPLVRTEKKSDKGADGSNPPATSGNDSTNKTDSPAESGSTPQPATPQ